MTTKRKQVLKGTYESRYDSKNIRIRNFVVEVKLKGKWVNNAEVNDYSDEVDAESWTIALKLGQLAMLLCNNFVNDNERESVI